MVKTQKQRMFVFARFLPCAILFSHMLFVWHYVYGRVTPGPDILIFFLKTLRYDGNRNGQFWGGQKHHKSSV